MTGMCTCSDGVYGSVEIAVVFSVGICHKVWYRNFVGFVGESYHVFCLMML